jgi:hypothetical protein
MKDKARVRGRKTTVIVRVAALAKQPFTTFKPFNRRRPPRPFFEITDCDLIGENVPSVPSTAGAL